jgi:hypothetical protein
VAVTAAVTNCTRCISAARFNNVLLPLLQSVTTITIASDYGNLPDMTVVSAVFSAGTSVPVTVTSKKR